MEYGTIVFLKTKNCLCKYIIHKEDEKLHLLQRYNKLEYNGKPFYELSTKAMEKDIVLTDEIESYILFYMDDIQEKLDKLQKERSSKTIDCYYQSNKDNIKEQIAKLNEKEETPERLKAKKELEKALRRKEKASKRDCDKDRESLYYEIRKQEELLIDLRKELAAFRRYKKKKGV